MEIIRTRNALVLAKLEDIAGATSKPDASKDAILVESPKFTPSVNLIQTNEVRGSLDSSGRIVGGAKAEISFDVLLKGSGKPAVAPEFAPLLKACGFSELQVKETKEIIYKPHSGYIPSLTIHYYLDGTLYKIVGARGNMQLSIEAGGVGKISFSFNGMFEGLEDAVMPTPSYNLTRPAIFKNNVALIDNKKAGISNFSIDLGNKLTHPDNPNAREGFDPAIITERNITGSINPMMTLVATRNIMQDFLTGHERVINITLGSSEGNKVAITIPRALYTARNIGDREGIATEEVQFDSIGQDNGLTISFS